MEFMSPTNGNLDLNELMSVAKQYMEEDPGASYKWVIGTDSQTTRFHTQFVTALIIHRAGKGARFFLHKEQHRPIKDLRSRIYKETSYSLELMERLKENPFFAILEHTPIEIHIDIGQQGETKMLIQEIVGWVTAAGYTAKIKPYSFGASAVADRFTG